MFLKRATAALLPIPVLLPPPPVLPPPAAVELTVSVAPLPEKNVASSMGVIRLASVSPRPMFFIPPPPAPLPTAALAPMGNSSAPAVPEVHQILQQKAAALPPAPIPARVPSVVLIVTPSVDVSVTSVPTADPPTGLYRQSSDAAPSFLPPAPPSFSPSRLSQPAAPIAAPRPKSPIAPALPPPKLRPKPGSIPPRTSSVVEAVKPEDLPLPLLAMVRA